MARRRAAIDALLTRPVRVLVVMTHGNLMTLFLRSFETQFGFQAWEHLSNPDVHCIEMDAERVRVTRTWVPPLAASGTRKGINPVLKRENEKG
jgi:2,3-bisphosphoglycerate-dependent phosphoglycerate mutase